MADNIKYIRWAARVLKIIMVINIFLGFGNMFLTVGVGTLAGSKIGMVAVPVTGVTITFEFVQVLIQAFVFYTAARGLELLADMAYHILRMWHQSSKPIEPQWQSDKFNIDQ